ncbi:MAG: SAM-dependent methyltransferase [Leeuwenhoekiella sp.]|nr:MAG: SAM-dependent methyltransferase [Leeuwenhoekiella sp.]
MPTASPFGKLYLIPVTLGDTPPLEVMPQQVQTLIAAIDAYIVENEKTARRFIKQIYPQKSQPSLKLHPLNKHTDPIEITSYLDACLEGKDMGLMSEAGVPGVADPGSEIVRMAHEKGIQVVPLVGPSSILMAIMASGMNGQNFAFNGYLPIDQKERRNELRRLERISKDYNQSQLFIETPYRNGKMLDEICNSLQASTRLCIACDITLPSEFIKTQSVNDWKHSKEDLHKRPAIFIIHA